MGQRQSANTRDARIIFRKEDCASSMEQSTKNAAIQDALIRLSREECASSMVQRSNDAAVKDAQT
jgi:hypothetical protein